MKARRLAGTAAAAALAMLCVGCHRAETAAARPAAVPPSPPAAGQVRSPVAMPMPAPNDAAALVSAARRLMQDGQRRRAGAYALQAEGLLQASAARSGQFDPLQDAAIAGRLTELLCDLGKYDDAISLVSLQAPGDQEQDFLRLMLHLIEAKDRRGIARVLPMVTQMFATGPASALEGASDLAEVVRRLAIAGFRSQARAADHALDQRRGLLPAWQRLRLQADLGDVDGAIADANRLGPLTQPASPLAEVFAAAMTSAPRAQALAAIATDLAEAGRIADALRAEAPLEAAPADAVASSRDYALAAIADAQDRAGRRSAAQQTAERIYQPAVRAEALRRLGPAARS